MNYEERYNKLVESIKKLQEANPSDDGIQNWVNDNVPELRESEDERIRKDIIAFIKENYSSAKSWVAWLEKQGEQKATIIISKFRAGDWVVNNDSGVIQHIKEIVNVNGETLYVFDEDSVLDINFQEQYHLWAIEDAKDGDVLIDEDANVIGIFEGVKGIWWHSKFYYSSFTKELYGIECGGLHQKEFAKPATKEQRDTLMKAMADAGWEFDFEKKELKKVEQKSIKWSKEDEEHIESILKRLDGMCKKGATFTETRFAVNQDMDWLKSLKPQSHWKPSEEHIGLLQAIVNEPNNAASESCQVALKEIIKQMKKLKE